MQKQLEINDITHQHGLKCIAADIFGIVGYVFCDFNKNFQITDTTGEEPLTAQIASVSKDAEGMVTCLDEHRHGFEDGDYVTFSEVRGMTELNQCAPRQIKVLGPYTFSIGPTMSLSDYQGGGIASQVKMPKTLDFVRVFWLQLLFWWMF